MAKKNNYNPCLEVNKIAGKEICLDGAGNIAILDPAGSISNDSINHEDLFVYVSLKARVRTKSLLTSKPEQNIIETNFIKQKSNDITEPLGKSFLTTDWTNVGGMQSKVGEDLETFGITNIDINFNSGFIPQIVIDFIDIRGATLFEQGSCSPYGAFFHQPYPIFELTVKGFYGYPVKYYLSIKSFNTKFNANSGNYESKGEFIGYSYAFLSDISLGYVLAAPYMEGSTDILSGIYEKYMKHYDEIGFNTDENGTKFDPFDSSGNPLTLYQYVRNLQSLQSGSDGADSSVIAAIRGSQELRTLTDAEDAHKLLGTIEEDINNFKDRWETEKGNITDNIVTWIPDPVDPPPTNPPINDDLEVLYDATFSVDAGVGLVIKEYNRIIEETFINKNNSELLLSVSDVQLDKTNGLTVDLNLLINGLEDKKNKIDGRLINSRKEFTKGTNLLLNDKGRGIGFVPTMRSFFTVLMANTELFLELVKNASRDAEEYHDNNVDPILNGKGVDTDVKKITYAWPTYMVEVGDKTTEAYPGTNTKFRQWPEVRFIEDFLVAMTQMNEDITNGDVSGSDGIDYSVYNDKVGFDNYIAINTMESPAAQGDSSISYYNNNTSDKVFKTIGERFITLTNMTSVNSNYLNSSLILRSRNQHVKQVNLGYLDAGTDRTFTHLEEMFDGKTLYCSWGIPFNPVKFGGKDSGLSNSLTYDSATFKDISGVKGYPAILHSEDDYSSSNTVPSKPMGIEDFDGTSTKPLDGNFSSTILKTKLSGGQYDDRKSGLGSFNKYHLGYVEGINFATSVGSSDLIEMITAFAKKGKDKLISKVIEALGIEFNGDDMFFDKENSSYLYRDDIVLNPSSSTQVTLKPDIHSMDIDSLVTMKGCSDCIGGVEGLPSILKKNGLRTLDLSSDNPLVSEDSDDTTLAKLTTPFGYKPYTNEYWNKGKRKRDIDILNGVSINDTYKPQWWAYNGLKLSKYATWLHSDNNYGDNARVFGGVDKDGVIQKGGKAKISTFSQVNPNTKLSMCAVEVYPDYGFNYLPGSYDKFKGQKKSNKGDYTYRYIDNFKEITSHSTDESELTSSWFTILPSYKNVHNNAPIEKDNRYYDYNKDVGTIRLNPSGWYDDRKRMMTMTYSPASKNEVYSGRTDIKNAFDSPETNNKDNKLQEGRYNLNFINPGDSLIDTPFWKHNFPSKESGANTKSFTYSMFGSPMYSVQDKIGDDPDRNELKLAPSNFYIGLKLDIDNGLGDLMGLNGKGDNIDTIETNTPKINMLTTHNKESFSVTSNSSHTEISDVSEVTNLNRTESWKGSLAYLFLANQLHRPWTGMYTNNDTYYGPQSLLGTSSLSTIIPNHSVYLLGAVLWRMRESGLLQSDDSKWNIDPKDLTKTVIDPINVPLLPEKLNYTKPDGTTTQIFDTKIFGYTFHPKKARVLEVPNSLRTDYSWNHGVKPPMASLLINGNNIDADNTKQTGIICFPSADEWPAPNTGMINAIDLDTLSGFKNPFKNQYKIFTPVLGNKGSLALRFQNQIPRWLTNKKAVADYDVMIKSLVADIKHDIRNYGTGYKGKLETELFKEIEQTNKTTLENQSKYPLFDDIIDKVKDFAGMDESYTKLSYIYHDMDSMSSVPGLTVGGENGRSIRATSRVSKQKTTKVIVTVKSLQALEEMNRTLLTPQVQGVIKSINYIVREIGPSVDKFMRYIDPLDGCNNNDTDGSFDITRYRTGGCRETFGRLVHFSGEHGNKTNGPRQFEVELKAEPLGIDDNDVMGYLRGYIPIGPELWFLPVDVKNLFIKKFEDFVGDFNNLNNSGFDTILRTIDPLNFPEQEPKGNSNVFTKVPKLEGNLVYETFVSGWESTRAAPYVKLPVEPVVYNCSGCRREDIRGSSVFKGYPLPHEAVEKWVKTYSLIPQIKNVAPQSIKISNVKKHLATSLRPNNDINNIHKHLFNDGVIYAQSTPRIWWAEFPIDKVPEDGSVLSENNGVNQIGFSLLESVGLTPDDPGAQEFLATQGIDVELNPSKETTFDSFYFNEQELDMFVNGFGEALKSTAVTDLKKKMIDDEISDGLDSTDGGIQDDDIKLATYRSIKTLYDKWISASSDGELFFNSIGKDRLLIDHFSFVDRTNSDIGDRALINLDVTKSLFNNVTNSIFGVTSDILDKSNFNFHPLPSYVDLTLGLNSTKEGMSNAKLKRLANMFVPQTQEEVLDTVGGPHFLCMYVGGNSRNLDLTHPTDIGCIEDGKEKDTNGDSFRLTSPTVPKDFNSATSKGVVAFKVAFGSENQSHFLGVDLDQSEHKNTDESLKAEEEIAKAGDPGGASGLVTKSQSLYDVFLNRSYSCTVESMGNMMIQPLQYFELQHVPMFYGSYLIRDVKHSIRPHDVKTTFTGDRIPYATVPIIEDIVTAFNLAPADSVTGSLLNGGSSSGGGSGGRSGTNSGTKGCRAGRKSPLVGLISKISPSNGDPSKWSPIEAPVFSLPVTPGYVGNSASYKQYVKEAHEPLKNLLNDMINHFTNNLGYTKVVGITSLFRTVEFQQYLKDCQTSQKCNGGNIAATPGTSTHGWGLAVDLQFYTENGVAIRNKGVSKAGFNSEQYKWMVDNAPYYGFSKPKLNEHWHWEYYGKTAVAYSIKSLISNYSGENLRFIEESGKEQFKFVKNPIDITTGKEAVLSCTKVEPVQASGDGTGAVTFVENTYTGKDKGKASKDKAKGIGDYNKKLDFIGLIE